jgi:hypothetical protein
LAELDDLQDAVLRGIGRNVLNLQRMEGMLKFIVSSTGKFDAEMDVAQPAKDLEKSLMRRRKSIDRRSMGRLVENLSKTLQSGDARNEETTDSENGAGFEVAFWFEDKDFTVELSQALRRIVNERNDLIHKKLISFDHKSVESCRNLIAELDEQRARIEPQFEALFGIVLGLRDYFKQLKDYADSESFDNDLKRAIE